MLLNFNSSGIPCQEDLSVSLLRRWYRQSLAKRLLYDDKRLSACSRVRVPGTDVKILRSGEKFHYGGLMRCGSRYRCNVCATKISQSNASDLKVGVSNWLSDSSHYVSLLTLTVPHYLGSLLSVTSDKLLAAFSSFTHRKPFRRLSLEYGIVGRVRAFESTYGFINGWHPHLHLLLFSSRFLDPGFSRSLISEWAYACVSAGLGCPNEHGFVLQDGSSAAAYVSKWGLEDEMTKGNLKNGRSGSVSPFGLLDLYGDGDGDKRAGALFVEFAKYFKGKKQLIYSKGLRFLLGLGSERTDEQIVQDEDGNAKLFAMIPAEVWRVILREDMRGELLEVCKEGLEAFHLFLYDLFRGYNFYDGFRFGF